MKLLVIDGVKPLEEHFLKGKNVHIKFVTCGKEDCKCKKGYRHGPYYYVRKKIKSTTKDLYVKLPKEKLSFPYQAVGSSLLVEVQSVEQLPDYLKQLPVFMVTDMLVLQP